MLRYCQKLSIMFSPFWHKGIKTRIAGSLVVATALGFEVAIYIVTVPNEDDLHAEDWNVFKPLVVPVVTNAIQNLLFILLQSMVASELQNSMVQRIILDKKQDDPNCKNISFIKFFATNELENAIENLGTHIDGATTFCVIAGNFLNLLSMAFYWRLAYVSLEEARNILFATTGIVAFFCLIEKCLADSLSKTHERMHDQDTAWEERIRQAFRHNVAIVAGQYQNAEYAAFQNIIADKRKAMCKYSAYLGIGIVANNVFALSIIALLRLIINRTYPNLDNDSAIDLFIFALSLFVVDGLTVFYAIALGHPKTKLGLQKLYIIDKFLKELNALQDNPYLRIQYMQELDDVNTCIQFEDFTLAIPHAKTTGEDSIMNTIGKMLADENSTFIYYKNSFNFHKASLQRISSVGDDKSILLKCMQNAWPYASGRIRFACGMTQVFAMPREQHFVKNLSTLQNIFYPDPVPIDFANSDAEADLHQVMRIIGLEDEIARLDSELDWNSDIIGPDLKHKYNFLRMYVKATDRNHPTPQVLLLDAMTAGLDHDNAGFLEAIIQKLRMQHPDICVLFSDNRLESHPQAFSAEQKALIESDPDFFTNFADCETLTLERKSKEEVTQASLEPVMPAPAVIFRAESSRTRSFRDYAGDVEAGSGTSMRHNIS